MLLRKYFFLFFLFFGNLNFRTTVTKILIIQLFPIYSRYNSLVEILIHPRIFEDPEIWLFVEGEIENCGAEKFKERKRD